MNVKIRKTLFIHLIILFLIPFKKGYSQNPETGMCSYYASNLQGKRTASGEPYNKNDFTAAHNTLPFHTWVIVTNLSNNKTVKVRINDRGPHTKARVIDLSHAAADKIGLVQSGIARVKIEVCPVDSLSQPPIIDTISAISENTETHTHASSTSKLTETQFKTGKFYDTEGKIVKPNGYYIQISSYSFFDTFIINKDEWAKNQKKAVYCEVANSNSKKLYRLLIGGYPNKADADKELKDLNKKGIKGLIKKY